ncbi:MAG: hypothetical protein A3K19_31545 [Lentisphaerae bacterium RIFOXYB12_FULL_65_16]|nr:MAG: hypothetical protein A3K18_03920 [Lentisphaerae bacterium RIFOXYA12_64_32]OGV88639.1 MAG: hypothetical protein A3K19_31545 [Lentisphaerae bacterium RIFOXYB12_FULL_65_16]
MFPKPGWTDQPDPVASPYAAVGGEVVEHAGQYPKSLNYYLDNNVFTAGVFGAMFETLIEMDPMTLEYRPCLAEKWSISEDKKTFTFWLDARAKWSDGRPVTAADVKWTYDAVMDPKNMTGVHKVSLERLEPPEVKDERTIVFRAKQVHWENLGAAGGFSVLPRHVLEGQDFNKVNVEFPVVSGPYRLRELKEGIFLVLERREDWWRRSFPSSKGIGNLQAIKYKFFGEQENAFEAFKKGEIDVYPVYMARQWVNETTSEKFQKNWIAKQSVYNHHPVGFQGFAMNMRRVPFDDVRVRKAMAHLLDRDKMNATIMYNQYFLHRSYFEDLYDKERPCPNELVRFDKDAARQLLAEAGWNVNPNTGLREKDGKTFSVQFLTRDASSDKFLAIYAEDLKDVGVAMTLVKKDWAAWAKDMDEFSYDMTWAAWGAGVFKEPEGMWHSKEADRQGGNNITGFKDARVDELIEQQKVIFDVQKRHEICRQIDQIIFQQHPYVLLWNLNYVRLLYWNKFGTPDTVLSKYSNESTSYWWADADAAAELAEAMKSGSALPKKPEKVVFDDVFKTPGTAASAAPVPIAEPAAASPSAEAPAAPQAQPAEPALATMPSKLPQVGPAGDMEIDLPPLPEDPEPKVPVMLRLLQGALGVTLLTLVVLALAGFRKKAQAPKPDENAEKK